MLVQQGAEARVHLIPFLGIKAIAKQRFKKTYRHPLLDTRLTKERMIREARQLQRLQAFIRTPKLYFVDMINTTIYMEYIDAPSVRNTIQEWEREKQPNSKWEELGSKIGEEIALIHNQDCIHGDLTTSNILFQNGSLIWIDFGLSHVSTLAEDKGVDLYVLERAIHSTHPIIAANLFQHILDSYTKHIQNKEIISRFVQEVVNAVKLDNINNIRETRNTLKVPSAADKF